MKITNRVLFSQVESNTAMHRDLVIPPKKIQNKIDLRIIQKQEQELLIWKDPVFNYMDFFISDAYARHKSVISEKLKSIA